MSKPTFYFKTPLFHKLSLQLIGIHCTPCPIDDLSNDFSEVSSSCNWSENQFLLLNLKKTKELSIDFTKSDYFHESINIQNDIVKRVFDRKYL